MKTKPIVGILGGIGSGKSTVARQFANLGCTVIEADKIAHEVLDEKDIIDAVSVVFGKDVLSPDGMIDRPKLAARVFENAELLEKLQSIVHPPVMEQCERLLARYLTAPAISAVVLDIPLLMESGLDRRCNVLIFVESPPSACLQRARKQKGLSPEQIKKREKFQISLDKKRKIAQYIIQNNSDLSGLAEQVAQIYSAVMK
ncbi:MAG: dephospho-CoA kinase [Planctomycetes bacterium]|nr:dephospho-CoA kinase [Planctomycetota bacterium]